MVLSCTLGAKGGQEYRYGLGWDTSPSWLTICPIHVFQEDIRKEQARFRKGRSKHADWSRHRQQVEELALRREMRRGPDVESDHQLLMATLAQNQ